MNIFHLSDNLIESARFLMNKHSVKMPLESAFMLCAAHRVLDGKETIIKNKAGKNKKIWELFDERESILYGVSHKSHPSTIWTRTNDKNYIWHYNYFIAMLDEYQYRYGKIHACSKLIPYLKTPPKNIPNGELTPVTPAMDSQYIIPGDSVASYRNYYIKAKQHLADWSGKINSREVPEWYKNGIESLSIG